MPIETRSQGRELMVQFTCHRCKNTAIVPYDTVMTGEHFNYLHNSSLPPGWDKIGYSTIVCEACAKAYEVFMNPTKTEE